MLSFGGMTADTKQAMQGYIFLPRSSLLPLSVSFFSSGLPGSFVDLHRKLLCLGGLGLRVASHIVPP